MTHPLARFVLVAALLAGCDVEPGSATDYDVVAHVELDRLQKAAWMKEMLDGGTFDIKWDAEGKNKSESCSKLLPKVDAVTVGAGNERAELYIEGAISQAEVDACFDELEADLAAAAKSKEKGKDNGKPDTVRTAVLGDGVFAVAIGPDPLPTPSKARYKDLLDAEPSSSGTEPVWFTVHQGAKVNDIKYAEGWANASKGLDAHVQIEFKDEATASKLAAEATIALTAMKLSGEMKDLASAVKLGASGDTLTADVKADHKQMKKILASLDSDDDSKGGSATIKIETK